MRHPIKVSKEQARGFARRAVLLDLPAVPSVIAALDHHGYIQLDPLNICGRVHDLMLRNRVGSYQEGELLRVLHGNIGHGTDQGQTRAGFEHYIPGEGILAAWPLSAYRYIRAYLERIHPAATKRPFSGLEETLGKKILAELGERGPLTSDDFDHEGKSQTAWGSYGRVTKIVLEKLFAAGEILITARRGFRRVYDLASRVIPPLPANVMPSDRELHRWRSLLRVRQRRLVGLRRSEVEELGDLLQPIDVEGGLLVYGLAEDTPLLEPSRVAELDTACKLLAPLDPLIYDRKLTRALWDFDFTWEVYTPAAARKRGYYSLPVLAGLTLVGDIEPKADRKSGRLRIVSRRLKRGYSTVAAVQGLAAFLSLK